MSRNIIRIWLLLPFFLLLAGFASAQEDERWAVMLQGLKDQNYFDTALDYIDWMKTSPLCPVTLKAQIDYQSARIHLDAVESGNTFLPREEHIRKCRKLLEKFLQENPQSDLVFETQSTLGRLFSEEGRVKMLLSVHELTKDADREKLRLEARDCFTKAMPSFEAADQMATEQAKKLQETQKINPAAVKDDALFAAYGRFLAGKMMINLTKSDIAKTFPVGSKEFKDGLTEVARSFSALSSKYNEYTAGFEAKLYAAKAYQDLGDYKTSRALLGELNTLDGDAFQKILTESLTMALEMNLLEKIDDAEVKKKQYLDSINRARGWNENVPAAAKRTQDGQKIFVLAAKNFIAYAELIKANKIDSDKAIRDAGIFLRQVRATYPPVAKEAQELLQKIGAVKINKERPENYNQAKEFAEDDWQTFAAAFNDYQIAKDSEREKAKKAVSDIANRCLTSLNLAINMRESGTPMTEINTMRLNLVRIYWSQGKLLEAALLADYLAQHYSELPDADKTAVMAVKLYRQIFVEDKLAGNDPTAIADKLEKLCEFILSRWEGQEVAGEVQLLRIETAIDNGNLDEAKKLLNETDEGTPQRVSAELKIGQSLWNRYATLSKLPEDADEKPAKKELDELLAEAKKQLELGLNGKVVLIKEEKISVDAACTQSALALAQICLNANESQKTIDWLTNPQTGPLALLANPPGTVDISLLKSMQLGAMMLVLRAYVASEQLDKAEETITQLEATIKEQAAESGGASEEQKLTQIYISLGRQLETRLKELNDTGELGQAEKVAAGFEMFLKRILYYTEEKEENAKSEETPPQKMKSSLSFQTLYWIADTYYRLGSGMSTEKSVSDEAAAYYSEAAKVYRYILKKIEEDEEGIAGKGETKNLPNDFKPWAPERAADTIKARFVESLRCVAPNQKDTEKREKIFASAMEYITALLKDSEGRIDIQMEAAKTLEAWGKFDLKKLNRAVAGQKPIWGWNGVIKRTSINIDRFPDFYYEAYLNKFRCVLEIVRNEKDEKNKEKLLSGMERDFIALVQLRPQLGGQEWFARFDQIYKKMAKETGKKTGGIKELLKTLNETQVTVQAVDNVKKPESTKITAAETPLPKKAKPSAKPAKKDSNVFGMIAGTLVAIVIVPVVYFVVIRKKKKRQAGRSSP